MKLTFDAYLMQLTDSKCPAVVAPFQILRSFKTQKSGSGRADEA